MFLKSNQYRDLELKAFFYGIVVFLGLLIVIYLYQLQKSKSHKPSLVVAGEDRVEVSAVDTSQAIYTISLKESIGFDISQLEAPLGRPIRLEIQNPTSQTLGVFFPDLRENIVLTADSRTSLVLGPYDRPIELEYLPNIYTNEDMKGISGKILFR